MLRASTDPAAPNYTVCVTPGTGIKVRVRSAQGGNTTKIANPAGTVPQYLMVNTSGNTFTAYTSPTGPPGPSSPVVAGVVSCVLAGCGAASPVQVAANAGAVGRTSPTLSPSAFPSATSPQPTGARSASARRATALAAARAARVAGLPQRR